MSINFDGEILAAVKTASVEFSISPGRFIEMGRYMARWQEYAVMPNFPPFPHTIDEAEITLEVFNSWPEWVGELAPPGSKWERLHWPDGSITVRLVNSRALVRAAVYLPAQATEFKT
jgi:hypothetical protein